MKLKDSTFAIIAEKKDSISHKWFNQYTRSGKSYAWWKQNYYIYDKGRSEHNEKNKPINIPIYTESEFEALLKAEQLNETLQRKITDSEEVMKNAETLSQKQIESVISWMETWEQLRDTSIPMRFREDFRNKLKAEEFNEGVDLQRQSAERMINLKPKAEQENEPKFLTFDESGEIAEKQINNQFMKFVRKSEPLTEMPTWQKIVSGIEPKQITISYNLAIEYIAERLNVDKGIIKIEMP